MKKIPYLVIFTILFLSSNTILAQSSESEVAEEIKDKQEEIQKIKESIEKQVAEEIKGIQAEQKKIGWLGTIKQKDATTITIETRKGEREVFYNEETKIVDQNSQTEKIDNLNLGDKIATLGYQQSNNSLEAKRIIKVAETPKIKKEVLGTITDKSTEEDILMIIPVDNKDEVIQISLNKNTEIKTLDNKDGTYDNLGKSQKIAVVYETDNETNINIALLIRIISEKLQE